MNSGKLWDELPLCIVPMQSPVSRGILRSIASCAVKFSTEVELLKIVGSSYLRSPTSLDLFTWPSPSTVTLNSPVEICWLQIIVVLDCKVAEIFLEVPLSTRFTSPRPQLARIRLLQTCTVFWPLPWKSLKPLAHSNAKGWVPGFNNWTSIKLVILQRRESLSDIGIVTLISSQSESIRLIC